MRVIADITDPDLIQNDFGADRTATTTNSICASYPILKHAWINKPITPARPVNRLSDQPNSL
jgi:hypothetical protein